MDVGKLPNHVNIVLCVWFFFLWRVFFFFFFFFVFLTGWEFGLIPYNCCISMYSTLVPNSLQDKWELDRNVVLGGSGAFPVSYVWVWVSVRAIILLLLVYDMWLFFFFLLNFNVIALKKERTGGKSALQAVARTNDRLSKEKRQDSGVWSANLAAKLLLQKLFSWLLKE